MCSGGARTSRQPGHFKVTKVVRQVMQVKRSEGAMSFRGQKILKPVHRMHFSPQKSWQPFYSVSALLAVQSAVLARGIPSVCPSIRLSVRHVPVLCPDEWRYTIVRFSANGGFSAWTIPLVSGEVKFIQIFAGDHPSGDVNVRHPTIDTENLTNNPP